jgi:TolB-like protein
MSDSGKAVFLSYASQDAETAKRICDALRAAGVEVWFDRSELVGGDQWDTKIRGQIAACALFVPLISANTQVRREGYFRLEWKLADERTHLMAEGTPFLLPVVIDAMKDREALVPKSFPGVQWIHLPGGETSAAFINRVQALLDREATPASAHRFETKSESHVGRSPAPPRRRSRFALAGAAFAIVVAIGAALFFSRRSDHPAGAPPPSVAASTASLVIDKSIAVLPFANLSAEKDNEFFADGMHDELLTALSKIGALKVISRTSVLAYRDPAKRNLKQIAAELGVAHVLEGSVSRAGNRVRIIVQLIDAATDQHRWAETYNRDVSDVFQVQADISAQIAQQLAATISPGLKLALAQKLTSNPAAYDLYLRARRWREDRWELKEIAKWEELVVSPLEQAVALDPKFATAYAELSQIHAYLYWWPNLDPTPARLAKAKAAVDTALLIDPALPVAHLALGNFHYRCSFDYARATEEFAIALAGMPGDADVLETFASMQRRQGRWAEATVNIERAFALSPRNPETSSTWVACLIAQRYYVRAEQAAERALPFFPASGYLLRRKAQARFARDNDRVRYRSALAAIPDAPEADPQIKRFLEAMDDGHHADAVKIFEEAPELVERDAQTIGLILRRYFFAATAIGEREKMRVRALAAIAETTATAPEHRGDWNRLAKLALYHAYAGQPDEARGLANRTLELMPVKRDASDGPLALAAVAQVHLALGDRGRALALLDQALSVPGNLIANVIRLEPWWAPLRADPRFQAALAKAAPRD